MQISLKDLSFDYLPQLQDSSSALKNITVNIDSGSFIGIVGGTGSGKTTLAQILGGLRAPTSGHFEANSKTITSKKDRAWLRSNVGMVFQFPEHQIVRETVEKDIAFGLINRGCYTDVEIDNRVIDILTRFNIPLEWKSRELSELSPGQLRLVTIAGTLVMEPKILILDEPTVGLDYVVKRHILDTITQYHRDFKPTVILVTHQMEDILKYAERCLVLQGGEKAFEGSLEDLFKQNESIEDWQLLKPQIYQFVELLNQKLMQPLPISKMSIEKIVSELDLRLSKKEV